MVSTLIYDIISQVREDIPSRELNEFDLEDSVEEVFVEINLRKSKWILLAAYKPPTLSRTKCFEAIGNALNYYSKKYQQFFVMVALNTLESEDVLQDFLEERDLKNLVRCPTCFKSTIKPDCY